MLRSAKAGGAPKTVVLQCPPCGALADVDCDASNFGDISDWMSDVSLMRTCNSIGAKSGFPTPKTGVREWKKGGLFAGSGDQFGLDREPFSVSK